jgi:hypothetical protein
MRPGAVSDDREEDALGKASRWKVALFYGDRIGRVGCAQHNSRPSSHSVH